ncbi:MAG: flagellar biosynthesis protein FlhB [Thermoleophilia bacterium]
MADPSKTEKATPKRREEARKKGQVARSMEINTAFVLLAAIAVLGIAGPRLLEQFQEIMTQGLQQAGDPSLATRSAIGGVAGWALGATIGVVAPFFAVGALAGLIASVSQVGFQLTPKAVAPSFKKINPLSGFKRVFGPQSLFELVKNVVKVGVVGLAAFLAIWPKLPELAILVGLPPAAILAKISSLVLTVCLWVGGAFVLIAVADAWWQRYQHEKGMRMTKEEVKREAREGDVAPEVKGQIKRRQFELARRRMLAEVPSADVVVTNPTHFAVALRYDGKVPAPEVVAKGQDHVAAAIRRVAEEHGVPILSNPPLARALYREVELGQMIPEAFYSAVAEVLAFVYRTARRSRARTA